MDSINKEQVKRWLIVTILLQLLIIGYFEVTEYVNLFPFNDVAKIPPNHKIAESLANDLPKLILAISLGIGLMFWLESKWYRYWIGSIWIYYLVFLCLQLYTWWPRYIFGATPDQAQKYYEKFSHTIKILPSWDNHLAPDLQHLILESLTLTILIVMGIVYFRLRKYQKNIGRFIDESLPL